MDTINTIIIDLFHPNPEDLGPKGAKHDILATSESGVCFALYFKKTHRLYCCDDIDHETNIIEWHNQDTISQKNNLSISDAQNLEETLVNIKKELKGPVRLILNGQGNLAKNPNEEDTIAGYNSEEFIEVVDKFIDVFDLKNNDHPLFELIISSCSMAKSTFFVQALTDKYNDFIHSFEIILFKEIITFSRNGEFTSFFKEGDFKIDTFGLFSPETTLSVFCPSVLEITQKESIAPSPLSWPKKPTIILPMPTLAPQPVLLNPSLKRKENPPLVNDRHEKEPRTDVRTYPTAKK